MQASDIPVKIPTPWAAAAAGGDVTAPIPLTPQTGGHASYQSGFPHVNFVPIAGGGIPPWGNDVNGIHAIETQWLRWLMAGGVVPYDGTFQTAIGGYPAGAVVTSATTTGLSWVSTTDNNVTNPDSAGAGWLQVGSVIIQQVTGVGTTNVTVPAYCASVFMECWGAGGGASGSNGGSGTTGASGAGGGYAAGWFSCAPGQTLACFVGTGGAGAVNGAPAGDGVLSRVVRSAVTLINASGGTGGGGGPGVGGVGTVGQLLRQGQAGQDLDGLIGSGGTNMFAVGGNAAGGGGLGGNVNNAGTVLQPTQPGGGGGANFLINIGENGAAGGVDLYFTIGYA